MERSRSVFYVAETCQMKVERTSLASRIKEVGLTTDRSHLPLFFRGALMTLCGLALYFGAILVTICRLALNLGDPFRTWNMAIVWYSGVPTTVGIILVALDLALFLPAKRRSSLRKALPPVIDRQVVVALTSYNDAESIGRAVTDFRSHPRVRRVIVVDNNSSDDTFKIAFKAGARVVTETETGYGQCVFRSFQEALEEDGDLILLCEGDMTFRAYDIEKFLAYIDHADIVNGTRIVEQLREYSTQLSTFMYYGNFF